MQLLDHALLLQLGQDGPVLLFGAIADVQAVGLAQGHVGLHELPDGRAEGADVALNDLGSGLVLGLELRRHGVWVESEPRAEEREAAEERGSVVEKRESKKATLLIFEKHPSVNASILVCMSSFCSQDSG